ncbi:MAG: hypothetical protein P1U36_02050 [Legionellaceae bacterium]|nr:hypothetical protein [Legionellaceae bacterium]
MDNIKKHKKLLKEFVSTLTKAQDICLKCGREFNELNEKNSSVALQQCITRNKMLQEFIIQATNDLDLVSPGNKAIDLKNHQAFNIFQTGLNHISLSFRRDDDSTEVLNNTDVSKYYSKLDRIGMELTDALRGLCQRIEAIFTATKFDADKPNLDETRFALRATGHSQFLPRPMKSLNDAMIALDDISSRLNTCIELNNEVDNASKSFYEDPSTFC